MHGVNRALEDHLTAGPEFELCMVHTARVSGSGEIGSPASY